MILGKLEHKVASVTPEVKAKIEEWNKNAVPFDSRFPNMNQTKNCYQNFLDYHRCIRAKGEDYKPCHFFKKNYSVLCPIAWHAKWTEQVEEGVFAGRI